MKTIIFIALAAALAAASLFYFSGNQAELPAAHPEVSSVSRFSVTIAWRTESAMNGAVYYRPAGQHSEPLVARESIGPAMLHEVTLTGLSPQTRYTYWMEGLSGRFQIQTQPTPTQAFSFSLVRGLDAPALLDILMDDAPDMILTLDSPAKPDTAEKFRDILAYTPVLSPQGSLAPIAREISGNNAPSTLPRALEWGGLRLVLTGIPEFPANLLGSSAAHTVGIVLMNATIMQNTTTAQTIARTDMHKMLTRHNAEHPEQSAAFVLCIGEWKGQLEVDDIHYVGVPAQGPLAARLDVDVDSARIVAAMNSLEADLNVPPVQKKLTCQECRRLADKGAYEESVTAYETFIRENTGHYQVDDAYFAVAEIFDEKLFDFPKALHWYKRLIHEYPNGSLTPLARQRVETLTEFSDLDFKPFAAFERIRKIDYARAQNDEQKRNAVFNRVEELLASYPDSRIAPVMAHWMGRQLTGHDTQRAIAVFARLAERYPEHTLGKEAQLEIADTLYAAGQDEKARIAYEKALTLLPNKQAAIEAQIRRCTRNLMRINLYHAGIVVAVLLIVLPPLLPPAGTGKGILAPTAVSTLLIVIAGSLAAWMIREQFSSQAEMIRIVAGLTLGYGLLSGLSALLGQKLAPRVPVSLRLVLPMLYAAIGVCVGMYLTLFTVNRHILVVLGL